MGKELWFFEYFKLFLGGSTMSSLEMYNNAFKESFGVEEKELEGLEYQEVTNWDSVGHMNLIAATERIF